MDCAHKVHVFLYDTRWLYSASYIGTLRSKYVIDGYLDPLERMATNGIRKAENNYIFHVRASLSYMIL